MTYQAPERKTGHLTHIDDERGWGKAETEDGAVVFMKRQDFKPNGDGLKVFPVIGTKLGFIVLPPTLGRKHPRAIAIEVMR